MRSRRGTGRSKRSRSAALCNGPGSRVSMSSDLGGERSLWARGMAVSWSSYTEDIQTWKSIVSMRANECCPSPGSDSPTSIRIAFASSAATCSRGLRTTGDTISSSPTSFSIASRRFNWRKSSGSCRARRPLMRVGCWQTSPFRRAVLVASKPESGCPRCTPFFDPPPGLKHAS